MTRAHILSLLILTASLALAKGDGDGAITFPSTQIAPEPVGIVFPGATVAGGVNPAALARIDKSTAIQEAFTPSLSAGDPTGAFVGLAASNKKFGVNFGYRGPSLSGGNTHGIFVGGGYQFSKLALGFGLRDTDLSGGFSPTLDVGVLFGKPQGFSGGFVLYALDSRPQLALGMGYRKEKKFHYEASLKLPAFAEFGSDPLTLTGSVTVIAGIFQFYIRSSASTQSQGFTHTLGLLGWVTENFNLIAHFTTPRTITVGTTLVF